MTTQTEALKLALEYWENGNGVKLGEILKEALAQPAVPQGHKQEPVAWNVINPKGEIVATESNAIRGWARIQGYKPTVEGLLGFHEKGWRVVPATTPPQRTWVHATEWRGLTDDEIQTLLSENRFAVFALIRAVEAKLKEKNFS